MKLLLSSIIFVSSMLVIPSIVLADGFYGGVPVSIQKSDYSSIHSTFVKLDAPIATTGCTSNAGLVILDNNESSKAAMTFALTALASGKKFTCYVVSNQCAQITGAVDTYPVCGYYPTISN
jgi:hypothetical protein